MKLLLTSAGITNDSIANALKSLIKGKIKIAFIPTAANIEEYDKAWLVKDYVAFQKLGEFDIVDISAIDKDLWLPRLEKANVLVFGGGNTAHLMYWVNKSGLIKLLPELLKERAYVGISAGSMITAHIDSASASKNLYGETGAVDIKGLKYVDFNILPHLNSPYFPNINEANIKKVAKEIGREVYALDDQSAILWMDGKIEVISEGTWKKYE